MRACSFPSQIGPAVRLFDGYAARVAHLPISMGKHRQQFAEFLPTAAFWGIPLSESRPSIRVPNKMSFPQIVSIGLIVAGIFFLVPVTFLYGLRGTMFSL